MNAATLRLKSALLNIRDLLVSVGPLLLLVLGLLIAAYWWLDPQPPKQVRLATGPEDSAYANFGERYKKALAASGIHVEAVRTEGGLANLALLRKGDADVAFVRGGAADPEADEEAGIVSLGSLFYEPIWIFYRKDVAHRIAPKTRQLDRIPQLAGLRVNVDRPGSGTPEIMDKLLAANHLKPEAFKLVHLEPDDAASALQKGKLDALVMVSAPQSRLVHTLLRDPKLALMPFEQNEAYARRLPFLSMVTLPRGVVDLARDLPPQDVPLLATTTALLARNQTHPALRQLFAQAAQGLHSSAGWFNGARDFPNTKTSELPVSTEGDRAINGTPPIWQRYLPFWASNLLERMWLVLGGLLVLMLPLSRVVPPLYNYRVRSRVFRWYERLRTVESKTEHREGPREDLIKELEALERLTNRIAVPLSHAEELFALRNNIHAVRKRLLAQWPEA
ncbi:MAG: ABC transporter substrate-binding protein [Paucibacter sp.]|nr:ABC transporter substrate-binding protein [Roseateles sp.]